MDDNIIVKCDDVSFIQDNNFKKEIKQIYAQSELISQNESIKCVNKIIDVEIPKEYRAALRSGATRIFITTYSFNGSHPLLQKSIPLLINRLSQIGIYKVEDSLGSSIMIDVENITEAMKTWSGQSDKL